MIVAFPPLLSEKWKHWWEGPDGASEVRNLALLSLILSVITAIAMGVGYGMEGLNKLGHTLLMDFIPFLILVGVPFAIAGGIKIEVQARPTPFVNCVLLAFGCLLGSLLGTIGASVLMIRPLLAVNRTRKHKWHSVVAFIWLVSNMGGLLTPIGPPLVMGFLQSDPTIKVPFEWPLFNLFGFWTVTSLALLAVYFVWDTLQSRKEEKQVQDEVVPVKVGLSGWKNVAILLAVVASVVMLATPIRELVLVALGAISYFTTPSSVRVSNGFSWKPMKVVAALFAGIFVTMAPALLVMTKLAPTLGVDTPLKFYLAAGNLSGWLDNAPTYLVFCQIGRALHLANEIAGLPTVVLAAISAGAASWGMMTYIGNAPNLLVKGVAEEKEYGIQMPSFMGYVVYTIPAIIVLLITGWVFFGG